VQVKAALSRDGVEVAASSREELRPAGITFIAAFRYSNFFYRNGINHSIGAVRLLMRVPGSSVPGDYSLRVEGINDATGARVFSNSTALDFSPRFLTIIVQTSRPIYCNGQDGIF